MKRFISLFLLGGFFLSSSINAQDAWSWQGANDGWSGAGGCSIATGPDFLTMTITGNQPHIQSPTGLGWMADSYESLTVTVRNLTTGPPFQLKWFDGSNTLLVTVNIPVDGDGSAILGHRFIGGDFDLGWPDRQDALEGTCRYWRWNC